MTTSTSIQSAELPATIRDYLAAHAACDVDTALGAFAPSAVVVDQDETCRGTERILLFLRQAGAEFSYTTELTGAERVDEAHWVARIRLEGDFPGGAADLSYSFAMEGELITELVIAS